MDTPLATISNIPSSPGALRLIRVQGYDHAFQPLAAYEAWGYYDSQPGVQNIQVDLSRRQLLLGRILSAALTTQPLLFASLDPVALQSVLIEAMNYNADTGEFGLDPSFFDISNILALLPPAGSLLPTASDLRNNSMATRHDLLLTVVTPQGLPTDESVRLAVNAPQTRILYTSPIPRD